MNYPKDLMWPTGVPSRAFPSLQLAPAAPNTWNVISDRAFWWGMAAMLVMSMFLRRIVRR